MKKASWTWLFVLGVSLLNYLPSAGAYAQENKPYIGQAGKDVIWVPTPDDMIDVMLELAEVTPKDHVIDLGSGDGRIVIAAAKKGATALGIEFNPDLVELARRSAEEAGVLHKASFLKADFFESDLSKATVITMYLLPNLNLKLRPILLNLKPGTRIVSHSFDMGEWEADQTFTKEVHAVHLWVVPAKVEGPWTWREDSGPITLRFIQHFQKIEGTVTSRENSRPILNAQLVGDSIKFNWGKKYYSGKVGPDGIRGVIESQNGKTEWTAVRALQTEKQ